MVKAQVMLAGWGEPEGEWTQQGWREWRRNLIPRVRWCLHVKERLVICNEEDADGRARVTTHKERALHVDWTEIHFISVGLDCAVFYVPTNTV